MEAQICKHNIFKDDWGVFLYFSIVFVINKGCKGPDLVNILEVPKMIQKVFEYVRGLKLAIWELLTFENPQNILRNQGKPTNRVNKCCIFDAWRVWQGGPVLQLMTPDPVDLVDRVRVPNRWGFMSHKPKTGSNRGKNTAIRCRLVFFYLLVFF